VDREDGRRASADERDEQARVPVVRVHDVGRRTGGDVGRDGATPERVPLVIIRVPVGLLARDPLVVAHEHGPHAVAPDLRVADARARLSVRHRPDVTLVTDAVLRAIDAAVERQVDRHLVAGGGERLWQRTGDVRQATDLDEGGDLGGREGDPHPPGW